jgi:hypothetical protein
MYEVRFLDLISFFADNDYDLTLLLLLLLVVVVVVVVVVVLLSHLTTLNYQILVVWKR